MKLIFLFAALLAAPPLDDQQAFRDFVAFYKTYTGTPFQPVVIKAYMAKLAADGLTPEEAQARLKSVQKVAAGSPREFMALHFDKVFAAPPTLFTLEPNAFLTRVVAGRKPGTALDVGMGQGRNAVFLAREGWQVTGYDLSEEGLKKARANAAAAGVKLETVLATHDEFDFGQERWDLIVMTYSFVNMGDKAFHQRLRAGLKRGGLVLVEQPNSGGTAPGPANALFQSFADLRVLHYEDRVDKAEWSLQPARIGRILAEKP